MSYRIGRVIGSKGPSFRAHSTSKPDELRDTSGIDVGARRNYDHEQAAVKKAEDDKKKREDLIKQRNQEAERRMKDTMREEMDSKGTEARVKIKNVSRPDDPEPTSADSKLSKTGQIKTKIIDEEKPLMSDKTLGLPSGLIAAARAVMEKKHDSDDDDARKMKGGKTKVDLEPETDDDVRDDSEKKMKKTVKEATHPKTEKEKKLAALAHPKDKITHKDVLVGRGVLAKEEVELDEVKLSSAEFTSGARRAGTGSTEQLSKSMDKKRSGPGSATIRKLDKAELKRRLTKEEVDLDEGIKIGSKVQIHAPGKDYHGVIGNVGEIRHGLHKTASKKYTVDYDNRNKSVMVDKKNIKQVKEEVDLESLTEEELEETLKKSQPAGEWIKDFVHSDNPKFAGKSKKQRMQMALGAYYAKQRNEEVEIDEAAGKSKSSIPVVTKKIDFDKVKQVRDARKAAKQARHQDTSHLPPGWKTTWNRNEETDMELTDEELERLNEIAAQLDEKITPSELRAQLKAKAAAKKTSDSETKSTTNEEVEELDENWSKGASRSYLTDRIAAGKSLDNADHYLKRSKGAEKLNPSMSKELKIKYHKEMAKFHKSGYHGEHPMAASTMAQAKKEVKKHKDAAAAIKSSMNEEVELTESKTHHQLMASYHERMASAKDVSDSDKEMHEKAFQQHRKASVKPEAYSSSANKMTKALLKEEVELDEAKRGRPRKNPAPDQKPGEDEEHEHIIMQLRKVVSTHGALPVKHLDGKSTKLTPQLAQHALNKHNAMKTADQKQDFEQKLHKSHDSMRAALGG